ncbi:ABC transporter ATP-binding protein [Rhodovibrionaceae bacterium A322]
MSGNDSFISINQVTKVYGGSVKAVNDANLAIKKGEFFALLGPSGCGKTTLLRMLAGFETLTEGQIIIDGQDMAGVPPNRRPINMVFQSYAVFPHMTVADNVAYGLKVDGVPKHEIAEKVEKALGQVKLAEYGPRKPDQLSGGQRQRVALARALVKEPKVLLLDEPLSALDAKLREAMQLELVRLQQAVGITFVIVTHDQAEALSMADRIAVMEAGQVKQVASPEELYEHPNCRFVADFIGKINLLDGRAEALEGDNHRLLIEGLPTLELPGHYQGSVTLAIRPEKVRISLARPDNGELTTQGTISDLAYYGSSSHLYVDLGNGNPIMVDIPNAQRHQGEGFSIGQSVWVSWTQEDAMLLTS